jgi:hypothetical protein
VANTEETKIDGVVETAASERKKRVEDGRRSEAGDE